MAPPALEGARETPARVGGERLAPGRPRARAARLPSRPPRAGQPVHIPARQGGLQFLRGEGPSGGGARSGRCARRACPHARWGSAGTPCATAARRSSPRMPSCLACLAHSATEASEEGRGRARGRGSASVPWHARVLPEPRCPEPRNSPADPRATRVAGESPRAGRQVAPGSGQVAPRKRMQNPTCRQVGPDILVRFPPLEYSNFLSQRPSPFVPLLLPPSPRSFVPLLVARSLSRSSSRSRPLQRFTQRPRPRPTPAPATGTAPPFPPPTHPPAPGRRPNGHSSAPTNGRPGSSAHPLPTVPLPPRRLPLPPTPPRAGRGRVDGRQAGTPPRPASAAPAPDSPPAPPRASATPFPHERRQHLRSGVAVHGTPQRRADRRGGPTRTGQRLHVLEDARRPGGELGHVRLAGGHGDALAAPRPAAGRPAPPRRGAPGPSRRHSLVAWFPLDPK